MSTKFMSALTRMNWTVEEEEFILREWNAALKPCGQARWGFILDLASKIPNRTPQGIRNKMRRLTQAGRIPRQRERSFYTPIHLSTIDAAYLAAMVDGEGSVHKLYRTKRKDGYSNGTTAQVVLCYNTDKGIIDKVSKLVPCAKVSNGRFSPNSTKPVYSVTLNGYQAILDVMSSVVPFMAHTEKCARVEVMLSFIRGRLEC